jgi:hypothetical protein
VMLWGHKAPLCLRATLAGQRAAPEAGLYT